MATNPDREEFLRRLEGKDSNAVEKTNPNKELEVQQLLEAHQLTSLELDPVSMKALCALLGSETTTAMTADDLRAAEKEEESAHFKECKPAFYPPEISAADVIQGNEDDSVTNRVILHQLQLQTNMIHDMQRQLNDLNKLVQQLALQQVPLLNNTMIPPFHARDLPIIIPPQPVQPEVAPPIPQQAPAAPQPTMFQKGCSYMSRILSQVSTSKTAEVCKLFWKMHPRHVRLDGRLFFKVLFMVSILSAKMMNKKNSTGTKGDAFWSVSYKFYLIMALVMAGFLIQSGYLEFLYLFFWKEGYPRRIYNGEVVDPYGDVPIPAVRLAVPAPNETVDNFLGGNIEPAPQDRGLSGVLLDVIYFFGSFFLSILPMWKITPRRLQGQRQEEQQQQPGIVGAPLDLDNMAEEDE